MTYPGVWGRSALLSIALTHPQDTAALFFTSSCAFTSYVHFLPHVRSRSTVTLGDDYLRERLVTSRTILPHSLLKLLQNAAFRPGNLAHSASTGSNRPHSLPPFHTHSAPPHAPGPPGRCLSSTTCRRDLGRRLPLKSHSNAVPLGTLRSQQSPRELEGAQGRAAVLSKCGIRQTVPPAGRYRLGARTEKGSAV